MSHALQNLLILDLDETLVHARREPLERAPDFNVGQFFVYKRPFLEKFLAVCFQNFRVAVWSSASDLYVDAIVDEVFSMRGDLLFVWAASKVTYLRTLPHHQEKFGFDLDDFHNQKRLKKVSKTFAWPMERIIIVDDSPEKGAQNYGNVVRPLPYFGDATDRELPHLASYLESIASRVNVRTFEKRNWHAKIEAMNW